MSDMNNRGKQVRSILGNNAVYWETMQENKILTQEGGKVTNILVVVRCLHKVIPHWCLVINK